MSTSLLLEMLRRSGLEHFYPSFSTRGITQLDNLVQLSMQDYNSLGVTSMEDRRRLFQLIQNIKAEYPDVSGSTSAPASSTVMAPASPGMSTLDGSGYGMATVTRGYSMSDMNSNPMEARQSVGRRSGSGNFGGRNFKEASEDEEEAIPVQEAKQRGLDAYSVPTRNKGTPGRNTGASIANDLTAKIRVCVRKRPLNSKEINRGEKDMAGVTGRQLTVDEPKVRVDMTKYIERHGFVFDEVFDSDATNEDVYRRTAYPLVQYLFEGGKATCFAYGQTGSGKTFTMLDDKQGLYVLAARDIFVMLRKPENAHLAAYIGFYEIYQGHLHDLLNKRKKLHPREDGKSNVVISGLKEYEIMNVEGLMQVFEYGNSARSTGSTNANADSSRSHAIMQIMLKDQSRNVVGKLSFIDLAGSERGADRGETDAKTRMEGAEINKSLLALKECIRALDQDKKHTPFRQSKLTQVLKDSFVGNSRTCMVATISPNNSNSEHTLNTLRYADRVKELKAEGGAKGAPQGQDASVAQEEYMDDVEGYEEDELEANVYDDDYLSSEGENVADVTIDLLEDEEFPDLLDQEEMDHHALAMTTYDHELEDPNSKRAGGRGVFGNQGAPSHGQQLPPQSSHQSASSRHMLQEQQPQQGDTDVDRTRGSPFAKSSRERDPQQASKNRKPEGLSRLPMPRNFQSSTPSSGIPGPQHRHSQSGASGRNNSTTSNSSPPLAMKSRESKPSPSNMSISPGGPSDYISQKGSNNNNNGASPIAVKHPSINTKNHQHSSSTSSNRNGAASAGPATPGGHDPNNYPMASPPTSSPTSEGRQFMQAEMDTFIQEHQAQMRDCAELTKRETKLLAQVTLGMSSTVHAQSTGFSNNRESFMKYLSDLDEIVDEKLITIVAMSQKLKALRGQM
ncbi:Kinesin-like protein kif24 [Haplosporangium gracile]|nr:Kinesin-like protein kif24 [Haplosporangium gracile]